ncbi:hypothetical protein [Roseivivax sp. THAF30]|uniref:hypothetical protein n=1 Tax=Roseivivax sp. THAF30 TaxID=2587852 RepID=UPI0012694702|nr:hypothetical protein [Roseivivax sp. THAF30]
MRAFFIEARRIEFSDQLISEIGAFVQGLEDGLRDCIQNLLVDCENNGREVFLEDIPYINERFFEDCDHHFFVEIHPDRLVFKRIRHCQDLGVE